MSSNQKRNSGLKLSDAVPGNNEMEAQRGESAPNGRPSTPKQKVSQKSGMFVVWKVLAVILIGVVILLATDTFEIKQSTQSDDDNRHHVRASTLKGEVVAKNHSSFSGDKQSDATPTATVDATPIASPTASETAPTADSSPTTDGSAASPVKIPATDDIKPDNPNMGGGSTSNNPNRHTYRPRGQPMSDADRQAMIDKWGSWTLLDDKERPQNDYYTAYSNRDIPRANFPSNAWQIDKDYVAKFLPEAIALVQRAQDAILAEYGKTEGSWEERSKMFHVELWDEEEFNQKKKLSQSKQGGSSTQRSWEGLKRRMLHAVMTEDNFVFAMGGHSAAAGHGNHFQQSYTLQVQWILEAVFARLGVRHQARNFGNGGMGTIQHGIAAGSIYGPDVDVLCWDSGMTENTNAEPEIMARQAMLGGTKVPAIWTVHWPTARMMHMLADADTGLIGTARSGIDRGTTLEQIEAMPWAMQYVSCDNELSTICRQNEYVGQCWVERDDYTPEKPQSSAPGGRATWHPGNRIHQVTGRVLAFTFLQALKEVLTLWNEAEGYELADDVWHVTEHYQNIRTKLTSLDKTVGACHDYDKYGLGFLCDTPMKGRTEFTPRAYPDNSSIRSLMRPEMRAEINDSEENVYNPPDVFNPSLHPPPGAIDVLNIVEAGVAFRSTNSPDYAGVYKKPAFAEPSKMPIGKGVQLSTTAGDSFCDGSVDSFCNRGSKQACLLYAHNDGRNGLMHNGYSGWVVVNIPDLKNGIIIVKIEAFHDEKAMSKTDGWTTVNNERRLDGAADNETSLWTDERNSNTSNNQTMLSSRRERRRKLAGFYCDDFRFEYALDGKVTSLTGGEFGGNIKKVERVVALQILLNDPDYTGGTEKEVELAMRIVGCGRQRTFSLNHVYWS